MTNTTTELQTNPITVYLDQSVLSQLQRQEYGKDGERLIAMAERGSISPILSLVHFLELIKLPELDDKQIQKKLAMAQFLDSLPNTAWIRHPKSVYTSFTAAWFAATTCSEACPQFQLYPFRNDLGALLSTETNIPCDSDLTIQEMLLGNIFTEDNRDALLQLFTMDRGLGLAESFALYADSLGHGKAQPWWIQSLLKHKHRLRLLLNHKPEHCPWLSYASWIIQVALDAQLPPQLLFPIKYIEAHEKLKLRRQAKPGNNEGDLLANDAYDRNHALAAPFVHVLVHEAQAHQLTKQACKQAGLPTKVFSGKKRKNGFPAAVDYLEGLCAQRDQ